MENVSDGALSRKTADALKEKDTIRLLFVCLGNICRSPAAEGVMKAIVEADDAAKRFEIDSAGTGNYHVGDLPDPRMRSAAARRGYRLMHRCRQVRESDFRNFDLIIGMDASNIANLRRLAPDPESERKIHSMAEWIAPQNPAGSTGNAKYDAFLATYDHIPDPYYEGAEGFERVLDLLQRACYNLYDSLKR